MTNLIAACVAFLATHYVSSTPLRAWLVARIGRIYLGLYSLLALATLIWMVWAYYRVQFANLWYSPALYYVPLLVMPFAMVFFVCGLLTRNPTLVGQEQALKTEEPARGILRITRHPLMWGVALWAASHLFPHGDAASVIFFGTFLMLALSGTVLIDRRKAAALGDDWKRFAEKTSNLPFAAIAAGRNQLKLGEIGWRRILLGLALYLAVLFLHLSLFDARPFF